MTKTAETHHDVHELIKKRWSARSFSDNAISLETLNTLIEAASWSASSMNEQPWKYIYAHRGTEAFDRMAACLMEGNKVWAKEGAVLLLSLAKKTLRTQWQRKPSSHARYGSCEHYLTAPSCSP